MAPEHLEIQVEDALNHLGKVKNAGSVFIGSYTPEAVGDYFAGPNHVLPTAGTARFSSGLSVDDFIKKTTYVYYSEQALRTAAPHIERLAGGGRFSRTCACSESEDGTMRKSLQRLTPYKVKPEFDMIRLDNNEAFMSLLSYVDFSKLKIRLLTAIRQKAPIVLFRSLRAVFRVSHRKIY